MDAFDQRWERAEKRVDSTLTIPAETPRRGHAVDTGGAVNRELVNQVVREGPGPRRPAGSP
jgi:hypothetical protein